MRTTLTIDDDLLDLLRQEAARTRRSVRQVLNDRLRRGFSGAIQRPARTRFVVEPFKTAGFAPGVDETKLNQLADVLETERHRR